MNLWIQNGMERHKGSVNASLEQLLVYCWHLQVSMCSLLFSLFGTPSNENGMERKLRTDHLASNWQESHSCNNLLIVWRREREQWKQSTNFALCLKVFLHSPVQCNRLWRLQEPWSPWRNVVEGHLKCLFYHFQACSQLWRSPHWYALVRRLRGFVW